MQKIKSQKRRQGFGYWLGLGEFYEIRSRKIWCNLHRLVGIYRTDKTRAETLQKQAADLDLKIQNGNTDPNIIAERTAKYQEIQNLQGNLGTLEQDTATYIAQTIRANTSNGMQDNGIDPYATEKAKQVVKELMTNSGELNTALAETKGPAEARQVLEARAKGAADNYAGVAQRYTDSGIVTAAALDAWEKQRTAIQSDQFIQRPNTVVNLERDRSLDGVTSEAQKIAQAEKTIRDNQNSSANQQAVQAAQQVKVAAERTLKEAEEKFAAAAVKKRMQELGMTAGLDTPESRRLTLIEEQATRQGALDNVAKTERDSLTIKVANQGRAQESSKYQSDSELTRLATAATTQAATNAEKTAYNDYLATNYPLMVAETNARIRTGAVVSSEKAKQGLPINNISQSRAVANNVQPPQQPQSVATPTPAPRTGATRPRPTTRPPATP